MTFLAAGWGAAVRRENHGEQLDQQSRPPGRRGHKAALNGLNYFLMLFAGLHQKYKQAAIIGETARPGAARPAAHQCSIDEKYQRNLCAVLCQQSAISWDAVITSSRSR